jgi:hypothetical protein
VIKYLITGSARSGTGYIAQVLKSAGIPCGHEAIFSHGGLDSAKLNVLAEPPFIADSSWLAAPFLSDDWLKDVVIIHLVRDPVKTIESILRLKWLEQDTPYSRFAFRHVSELRDWRRMEERAAVYWLAWNRKIASYATIWHRVEDDPGTLLDLLGIDYEGPLFDDKTYNHRPEYPPYELDWLALNVRLRRDIVEVGQRYRYLL